MMCCLIQTYSLISNSCSSAPDFVVSLPSVHKGLKPSGLSFTKLNIVKELLVNLPFKAHTKNIVHLANSAKNEDDSNKEKY